MSAFSYLRDLPPCRKFEFNPKLGIDNPVLSLAEDYDPSGNLPQPPGTTTSFPQSRQGTTKHPVSLETTHCLPLMTALVGSDYMEVEGGWAFSLCPSHSAWAVFSPTARHLTGQKPVRSVTRAGATRHKVTWVMFPFPHLFCCPPPHPDLWSLERPRFYLLNKEEGRTFGFHLQQQPGRAGHVVCRVEPGSSAQRQGLREGDWILGVNNHVVEQEDYLMVIRWIWASGPRVLLTVLALHMLEVARAQWGSSTHFCPLLGQGVRPRLCHIGKDEGGFGFSVTQGCRGPFWLVLSTGGAAEQAGVPPGARLLEVNGVSVEKLTHNQLNRKLWQSGKQVTLLVAGPEVEEQCRQLGMPLAAPLAEGWALPTKPRCLHLEKGPQGFGFVLREEKGLDGRLGQFLWEVDPGLPAEKAGMQPGDRLVAVAGESVEGLGHEETVSKIRAQGSRVSLIVVDPKADRFFSMVRLSPLLFLESTEAPDSPRRNGSASVVDTKNPPAEDTTVASVPCGFRQCFLYPGPGGGYGFRLSCVASRPGVFISQVTVGGSAAQAGLQTGDVILEMNGYPMGGENDLERLQQLAEAKPPLCLKLVTRSQQGLEAWIHPGSREMGFWPQICCSTPCLAMICPSFPVFTLQPDVVGAEMLSLNWKLQL
ncbi:Na(+)/H(+) exchange regulatory cofactor NHE-RF4-like isoform X2 [Moschus berezovskii]|uniref:Na(+)/H(+) exchange regulatory cofactor NHE-RF4-like isoform X2 n=1 Tax=Moschus berezovskii TaxID=68408 RepID=UPI002444D8BC|nr:Na(+)/H(+) exchange regulatory cofactor NHE-RF4-like isoform X2 [Moschus berezovskii]